MLCFCRGFGVTAVHPARSHTRQTEMAPMPIRSFCETRCTWSSSSTSSSTNIGEFKGQEAPYVQEKVVNKRQSPWSKSQSCKHKLLSISLCDACDFKAADVQRPARPRPLKRRGFLAELRRRPFWQYPWRRQCFQMCHSVMSQDT